MVIPTRQEGANYFRFSFQSYSKSSAVSSSQDVLFQMNPAGVIFALYKQSCKRSPSLVKSQPASIVQCEREKKRVLEKQFSSPRWDCIAAIWFLNNLSTVFFYRSWKQVNRNLLKVQNFLVYEFIRKMKNFCRGESTTAF